MNSCQFTPVRKHPGTCRSPLRSANPWLLLLLLAGAFAPAAVAETEPASQPTLRFDAAALLDLQNDFQEYQPELPDPQRLGMQRIKAYEEHPLFVYVEGRVTSEAQDVLPRRRLLFLKPSTFVLEERIPPSDENTPRWQLQAEAIEPVENAVRRVRVADGTLLWYPLPSPEQPEAPGTDCHRELHVFQILPDDREPPELRVQPRSDVEFIISVGEQRFQVELPWAPESAPKLAVQDGEGAMHLELRLLPSGVLPHGPEGVRLLDRWDSAYRRGRAGWDPGRPASDLREAMEARAIPVGRALELGCGSGINAIYLAQQGFDVTALDVAPTALRQAEQFAEEAGVRIRWVLADAAAPPEMEPFDFIFDRGCYHHVRHQDAAGYVQALRRLTRPGARVMILAANANEQHRGGPPRVHEHELRADFSDDFTFVWLKETRFDSVQNDRASSLAWNILLERKGEPAADHEP